MCQAQNRLDYSFLGGGFRWKVVYEGEGKAQARGKLLKGGQASEEGLLQEKENYQELLQKGSEQGVQTQG